MGTCLLGSGQEIVGPGANQLDLLLHEFCCLHTVKARVTPREWRTLLNGVIVIEGATASSGADWAALAASSCPLCFPLCFRLCFPLCFLLNSCFCWRTALFGCLCNTSLSQPSSDQPITSTCYICYVSFCRHCAAAACYRHLSTTC